MNVSIKAPISTGLVLLIVLLSLSLQGCGFHLRGAGQKLSELPPIAIKGGNRAAARLQIERILGGPGGPLVANADDAQVVINITEDRVEERVLTISTSAKVTEYELAYIVTFELLDNAGEIINAPQQIVLTDDFTFDAVVVLAKDRERDIVEQELIKRMAQRILRTTYQASLKK